MQQVNTFERGSLQEDILDFLRQKRGTVAQVDIVAAMQQKREYGKTKPAKNAKQIANAVVGLALKKLAADSKIKLAKQEQASRGRLKKNFWSLV